MIDAPFSNCPYRPFTAITRVRIPSGTPTKQTTYSNPALTAESAGDATGTIESENALNWLRFPLAILTAAGFLLLILALVFTITGCGSSSASGPPPAVVHAAPPAPYPGGCVNSSGKFGDAREYPGSYLALVDTACPLAGIPQPIETDTQSLDSCGKDQVVTLVTTQAIHVHAVRLWIGAGNGSQFETGMCLEIVPASGPGYKAFHKEWDKHVESNSPDQPFAVDFVIPAGSTVRLSREPHSAGPCNDIPDKNCATQEMAELWGDQ